MDIPLNEGDVAKIIVQAIAAGLVTQVMKIPALFRRQGKEETVAKEAEDATKELTAASGPDRERVQIGQEAAWKLRIRDLLAEHPDAATELRALKSEIEAALATQPGTTTYTQHIGTNSAGAQGPGSSATTINLR